tara:strand:- start:1090 stop:1650 length:561 start_codon:yes stop_codon:yes gene_type:complete
MGFQPIFPTLLWIEKSGIDNDSLLKACYKHKETTKTNHFSNIGGYQGDNFKYEEFDNFVQENVPKSKFNKVESLRIFSWVNINPKGSRNYRHHHFSPIEPLLFSGVYYVKVPENSGDIMFHDPRGSLIPSCLDMQYLYGNSSPHVVRITPKAGECYYFPAWLEHDVNENESEEDRISISFNIFVEL